MVLRISFVLGGLGIALAIIREQVEVIVESEGLNFTHAHRHDQDVHGPPAAELEFIREEDTPGLTAAHASLNQTGEVKSLPQNSPGHMNVANDQALGALVEMHDVQTGDRVLHLKAQLGTVQTGGAAGQHATVIFKGDMGEGDTTMEVPVDSLTVIPTSDEEMQLEAVVIGVTERLGTSEGLQQVALDVLSELPDGATSQDAMIDAVFQQVMAKLNAPDPGQMEPDGVKKLNEKCGGRRGECSPGLVCERGRCKHAAMEKCTISRSMMSSLSTSNKCASLAYSHGSNGFNCREHKIFGDTRCCIKSLNPMIFSAQTDGATALISARAAMALLQTEYLAVHPDNKAMMTLTTGDSQSLKPESLSDRSGQVDVLTNACCSGMATAGLTAKYEHTASKVRLLFSNIAYCVDDKASWSQYKKK